MRLSTGFTTITLTLLASTPLAAACGGGSGLGGGSLSDRGSERSDDKETTTFQMVFTELGASESEKDGFAHVRVHGPWLVDDAVAAETTRDVPFVAAPDWRGYRDRDALETAIADQGQPRAVIVDRLGNEVLTVSGEMASDRRFLRAVRDLDGLIIKAVARTEQAVAQARRNLDRGRDTEASLEVLRRASQLHGYDVAAVAAGLLEMHAPEAAADADPEVVANRAD